MVEMPQTQETNDVEEADVDVQEPEEEEEEANAQTSFLEIVEALTMGQGQLSRLKQANSPQVLRQFLLNDLYPILIEMANHCNWYIGNLHDRVSDLEEGPGMGEGISPEFAAELMEYIGFSLQVFGELIPIIQTSPEMLHRVQLLVAQAPGLMAKIQDITITEEEDEGEEDEREVPEVVEPIVQQKNDETQTSVTPVTNVTSSIPVEAVVKTEEPPLGTNIGDGNSAMEQPEVAPEPGSEKSASPEEEKIDG